MIVRIMFEGQFDIHGDDIDRLNEVDNQIVEAIADGDEQRFVTLMKRMHDLVLQHGKRLPDEEIKESDLILPAADSSIEEVREMFAGEGMIPG